jgi:serine/threonine protein kinase
MSPSGTDGSDLRRLLDEVRLLPPEQRAAWIERLEGDDALFKVSLRVLLRAEAPESPVVATLLHDETRPSAPAETAANFGDARIGETLLGRFKLLRVIGRGGMGVVFAAKDLQMQGEPPVAVKLLNQRMRANPIADAALQRECRKVRMLANDAIVRVFEFYRAGSDAFITMELLEGESLDLIIKRFPDGMPCEDAWPIIRGAADALAYAHRQDPPFVHSDFKPSNVFLTESGQVKVLDFGVARAAHAPDATVSGLSVFDPSKYDAFTPAYASCEMLARLNADPRDDVYALACVAYEVLAGKHPFEQTPADQARMLKLEPKPIAQLSARRNAALMRGLAFQRSDRTASVRKFIKDLALPDEPVADGTESGASSAPRAGRKRALVGVLALVILIGGYWFWSRPHHEPPATSSGDGSGVVPTGITATDTRKLLEFLGVDTSGLPAQSRFSRAEIRHLIESAPRRVVVGSTRQQIESALALCRQYSSECQSSWYEDEGERQATLQPFQLDAAPITVHDFRTFADATGYKTTAEAEGVAYAVADDKLVPVRGGSWRNAVNRSTPSDEEAVVGVSFVDATAYCKSQGARLPTEDEWEYVAQGPERRTFGWGEDPGLTARSGSDPALAAASAKQGIGGRYRGLSGTVWQWVDTTVGERKVLKGGSRLEANPANQRAATRRYELPDRADAVSGFRCARSVANWPDADVWLSTLK